MILGGNFNILASSDAFSIDATSSNHSRRKSSVLESSPPTLRNVTLFGISTRFAFFSNSLSFRSIPAANLRISDTKSNETQK